MKKEYFPEHKDNKMKNEGNVDEARKYFKTRKNKVLYNLIKQRYIWMNQYIKSTDKVIIELGCGAGLSKHFIRNKNLKLTDILDSPWIDMKMDALNINLPNNSVDVIICSHMIHHLAKPVVFFEHVCKKLKKGGRIIIQDINTSELMKLVLIIMKHEGYSDFINVFDKNSICNRPDDPWSANCSIPKLLFENSLTFEKNFKTLRILKNEVNECFLFLCSGGVIAKTFYLPINERGVNIIKNIDKVLVKFAPQVFALGRSIVLQKK